MILDALEKFKEDRYYHSTEASKDLGIPLTSLIRHMSGKRKWWADRWLLMMLYLGGAEIVQNQIVISTSPEMIETLKRRIHKYKEV